MKTSEHLNKVIEGDALVFLRTLADETVDMGVTSPPYNKGENKKGWLVTNVKYEGCSDRVPEDLYQGVQVEVLNELFRVTKPGGSFFYNHKIRWEKGEFLHPINWLNKTKWIIRQEIVWDRMIAANIRGWRFWQVDERIYWLYKPLGNNLIGKELKPKHALLSSVWRFPPERNNPHPAPFPLALPIRAIYSIMDDNNGIIIDPYCGSGTTLVAAKILGHSYIGIEMSAHYCRLAEDRLNDYRAELKYARQEIAKHFVSKTFKERKAKGEFTGKYKKSDSMTVHEEAIEIFNFDGL